MHCSSQPDKQMKQISSTQILEEMTKLIISVGTYLAILGMNPLAQTVDLLVLLSSVVVTLLSSTRNCEGHSTRMPSTNTRNLAQTLVRLARQFLSVPAARNTWGQLTSSHMGPDVKCVS
jgi:hypothetical protein